MQLSEDQIKRFQCIYQRRFGKEIGREEAREKGIYLVRMMQLIYKPMNEGEFKQVEARRRADVL